MSSRWRRIAKGAGRPFGWALVRDESDRVIEFVTEPMNEGFAHLGRSLRDLRAEVHELRQEVARLQAQLDGKRPR